MIRDIPNKYYNNPFTKWIVITKLVFMLVSIGIIFCGFYFNLVTDKSFAVTLLISFIGFIFALSKFKTNYDDYENINGHTRFLSDEEFKQQLRQLKIKRLMEE